MDEQEEKKIEEIKNIITPQNQPSAGHRALGLFGSVVEKANKTMNGEKSKQIKKKLIGWGTAGCVLGGLLIITGIVLFMVGMNTPEFGIPPTTIVGFVMFPIGGFTVGISSMALNAGISIVIAGVGTNILDTQQYCPKCGDRVDADELFCNKCGTNLRADKLCSCGFQNDVKDNFCKKCGKPLGEKK